MGERDVLGGLVPDAVVSRPVLVSRLLKLDGAGGLTAAHVRAGAQLAGVHPRTEWRWVEAARSEGRLQRRRRTRFELSEQAWEMLAQAGGNVTVLHRHLQAAAEGEGMPSLATLYRVVRRELEAGRVLPDRAQVRRVREEREPQQALADLAVGQPGGNMPSREAGANQPVSAERQVAAQAGTPHSVGLVLPHRPRLSASSCILGTARATSPWMSTGDRLAARVRDACDMRAKGGSQRVHRGFGTLFIGGADQREPAGWNRVPASLIIVRWLSKWTCRGCVA